MSPTSKLEAIRQYLAQFPMQDIYDVISALRNQGVVVSYSQVYETKRKKGAKMANQQSGVADIYLERFVKFGKETAGKRHHIRNAVKKLHTYLGTGTVSSISELEHFLEKYAEIDSVSPARKNKTVSNS